MSVQTNWGADLHIQIREYKIS